MQVLAASDSTQSSTGEAVHLRRLIEKQPACVLRVGIDGLVLAANDAAVSLLGAEGLTQVLGTKLTERIIRRHHEQWEEFAARIREGTSSSIECDLTDLSGGRRTILLQGVPLLDHADGIPSMILAARDTSTYRRLETALREREVTLELGELQKQLDAKAFAERRKSEASLAERNADHERTVAKLAAEWAQLRQTLAEEHQLALLAKEQEGQQRLDELRAELDQALAERQRLTALFDERETERAQLQQALAEEHQVALRAKEQELTILFEEREADHQRLLAKHEAERAQLQQTLEEEHQLTLLLKEREARQLDDLRTELEQARADQQRLGMLLERRQAEYQGMVADAEAGRVHAEQKLDAALSSHAQIEKALGDRQVELRSLDENARNLECLAAAGRAALEIGRELQTVVEAVDARTEHLLAQCSAEAAERHVIEALRDDAIGAASLARQIVQATAAAQRFNDAGGRK